jgi:small subunit ribosomal protein YMR-31
MFATKALRASAAHAERTPMIKFLGKRSTPSTFPPKIYHQNNPLLRFRSIPSYLSNHFSPASIDHTPHAHPASPSHELPADFKSAKSTSFSSYRQHAQQHGPLGRAKSGGVGETSGHALGPVSPAKGEYFDRNELPARFRRTPIDLAEIDAIETAGATLVC